MAYTDKADWLTVDPTELAPEIAKLYADYKAKYKEAKAIRDQFEQAMQAPVPEGKRMVFGYNFGKLSIAIVEGEHKAKAAPKATKTLADYLAEQANR